MKFFLTAAVAAMFVLNANSVQAQGGQDRPLVMVTIENVSPEDGVAITPIWVGFHSGSFDSYNGGLLSLEGLERVAEDGNNSLISQQFNNFDAQLGGYTYIDNSGASPQSALVRTGDLSDVNRQDGTLGAAPVLPGESVTEVFELSNDGSNDFFSYASMVLPTNDFFIANGNPVAHDISELLIDGGEISFFIGTPNGGVNDAGTESENFRFSAGNGLFPNRNLPDGQSGPNEGITNSNPIENVVGNPFEDFRLISSSDLFRLKIATFAVRTTIKRLLPFRFIPGVSAFIYSLEQWLSDFEASVTTDVSGLDFNQYPDGIARVTISVLPGE